ncbi:MAG TPA: YncE family protein, partial [Candidatus Polarisedimenticolaceae bacterium]|nr:YncE family protein [Candidatus Polarisedimenticolaceae bacterium]
MTSLLATGATGAASSEAVVSVYLQPLPAAAARLTFRPNALVAVRADGTTVPLELRLREVSTAETARTRLLAAGVVAAGSYTGLALGTGSATLRGDEGAVTLQTDGAPASIPFAFTADPARPPVIALELRYAESIREDARFVPSFAASKPRRPAVELFGLVTLPARDLLAVFDRVTGDVVEQVATGRGPLGVAIEAGQRRAYVACAGEDLIQAVDLADGKIAVSRRLRVGDEPSWVAVTPDGRTVVVANARSGTVVLLDAPGLTERKRIAVGTKPSYVRVDPAGRRAYVFDELGDAVSVLDLGAGGVAAAVASQGGPFRGELDARGERLYVIHRSSPYLTVFDTATRETLDSIYVGPGATA